MTKQQLKDELKQSMLARDAVKTSVLRMILASIQVYETKQVGEEYSKKLQEAGGNADNVNTDEINSRYDISEEEITNLIQKEAKQHRDSIEQFKSANRPELVEKESIELAILEAYLPAQMGEDEIKKLVTEAIAQTGASTAADMGRVMGTLMPKTKGKADGALVSKIVREQLQ